MAGPAGICVFSGESDARDRDALEGIVPYLMARCWREVLAAEDVNVVTKLDEAARLAVRDELGPTYEMGRVKDADDEDAHR